jgi:hypothetical protein
VGDVGNQAANQEQRGEVLAFHQQMELAYRTAVWRSGIDNHGDKHERTNIAWLKGKMFGLFLNESHFMRLKEANQIAISKLRCFFIEDLIKRTGKSEQELFHLLDVKVTEHNKNYVVWNKKESWHQSKVYQAMLKEEEQQELQQVKAQKIAEQHKYGKTVKLHRKQGKVSRKGATGLIYQRD